MRYSLVKTSVGVLLAVLLSACNSGQPPATQQQVSPTVSQYQLSPDERSKIISSVTERLAVGDADPFQKVSFYNSIPKGDITKSKTYFYLVKPEAGSSPPFLRLVVEYIGEGWIFFDRVQVLAGSDIVLDRQFQHSEVKRTSIYGSIVSETIDFKVDAPVAVGALKIAQGAKALMRLSGEKVIDRELTGAERINFAKLAEIFNELEPLYGRAKRDIPMLSQSAVVGPAKSTSHGDSAWRIQLGAFKAKEEAEKLVKLVNAKGFNAYSEERKSASGGAALWVVLCGDSVSRADAESEVRKLRAEAHVSGVIVTGHAYGGQ